MRAESTIAVVLATSALFAPAAIAQQDLRSPDVRDSAAAVVSQDLRSPDVRDASVPVVQDLRSPDAVDASRAVPVSIGTPVPVPSTDGFPWVDAGIVTGCLALLALLGASARRRHRGGMAGPGSPAITR